MKFFPVIAGLLLTISAQAATLHLGRFSAGDLRGWAPETFRGKKQTGYSLVKERDRTVLRADSRQAASGLLYKVAVSPTDYPFLHWTWKIDHLLRNENARTKEGDDFAARIYVIFPGTFFWQTRAINYIWSAKLPKGTVIPNAYTRNARMVVVESGADRVRQWVAESRNIVDDYRSCFGEEPSRLGGVAVMTDTDNTGDEAVAWYGDITLDTSPER